MFAVWVHGVCLPTHKPHTVRAERVSLCLQCEFLRGQILAPPSARRQTPPVSWQCRLLSVPPIRHDGCFFEGSRLSSRCPISGRLWLATLGWEVGEGGISHSADRADFFGVSVHWSPDTATKARLRVEDALPLRSVTSWSYLCLFYFIYCGWQKLMYCMAEICISVCPGEACDRFSVETWSCVAGWRSHQQGRGFDFHRGCPHSGVCTQLSNNTVKVTRLCGYWQRGTAAGGNVDQPAATVKHDLGCVIAFTQHRLHLHTSKEVMPVISWRVKAQCCLCLWSYWVTFIYAALFSFTRLNKVTWTHDNMW